MDKNTLKTAEIFTMKQKFPCGPQAVPIIVIDNEAICMGQSKIEEIISAIKAKL